MVFACTLIWYHKHRQTHTGHTGTSRLRHTFKYILTLTAQTTANLLPLAAMNK